MTRNRTSIEVLAAFAVVRGDIDPGFDFLRTALNYFGGKK
jgi:hypothetical protein